MPKPLLPNNTPKQPIDNNKAQKAKSNLNEKISGPYTIEAAVTTAHTAVYTSIPIDVVIGIMSSENLPKNDVVNVSFPPKGNQGATGISEINLPEFKSVCSDSQFIKAMNALSAPLPTANDTANDIAYFTYMRNNRIANIVAIYALLEQKRLPLVGNRTNLTDADVRNMVSMYYGNAANTNATTADNTATLVQTNMSMTTSSKAYSDTTYGDNIKVEAVDNKQLNDSKSIGNEGDASGSAKTGENTYLENNIDNARYNKVVGLFKDGNMDWSAYEYGSAVAKLMKGAQINLAGIIGLPPTYSDYADVRIDPSDVNSASNLRNIYGRVYSETFVKFANLVTLTPGVPNFLPGATNASITETAVGMGNLMTGGAPSNDDLAKRGEGQISAVIKSLNNTKSPILFGFSEASQAYSIQVKNMLRIAAFLLHITDKDLYSILDENEAAAYGSTPASSFDSFTVDNNDKIYAQVMSTKSGEQSKKGIAGYYNTILYNNGPIENNESLSNSVAEPMLANLINNNSTEMAREMSFLLNANITSEADVKKAVDKGFLKSLTDGLGKMFGADVTKLMAGVFKVPKIWKNASYSKQYNLRVKLASPNGDKLSIFKYVIMPLIRMLPYVLPRQYGVLPDSVISPFLVQVYSRGLIACEMGIITQMEINRHVETCNIENLPTEIDVVFIVEELNPFFSMPYDANKTELGAYYTSGVMPFLSTLAGTPLYRASDISIIEMKLQNFFQRLDTVRASPGKFAVELEHNIFKDVYRYFNVR